MGIMVREALNKTFFAAILLLVFALGACNKTVNVAKADQTQIRRVPPSKEFAKHWSDGKAELSSYDVVTKHYGQKRTGTEVFIYVTEPMDRNTWIKDDRGQVPGSRRENVLKLNRVRRFQTGIYDYSVMTSLFALTDKTDRERFAPVRITTTIQEWCGHTYFRMMPSKGSLKREIRSYFSHEGEKAEEIKVPANALYEDGLFIQLRELDDQFFQSKQWSGKLVPSYWNARKQKGMPAPIDAVISREDALVNGQTVSRVHVNYGTIEQIFDIEKESPRRILSWKSSDGETGTIKKTVRLPYWNLNGEGDESYLKQLDL